MGRKEQQAISALLLCLSPSLALAFLSVVIAYSCHGFYRSLYFADLARHRVLVD